MKLGVVSAYEPDGAHYPEEAKPFLDYMIKNNDVHLIHPQRNNATGGKVYSMHVNSETMSAQNLKDFDAIYFGLCGKNILSLGQTHCFAEQLDDIYDLLGHVQQYAPNSLVNPLQTIYSNTSKQYLLDLDLPFIDTTKVESFDQLKSLARGSTPYIAKPLVAERSKGTVVLSKLSDDELANYFTEYAMYSSREGSNRPEQGIIAQPYQNDFMVTGEKKIGVVGGNVTLSRVALPTGSSELGVVSTARGASMRPYTLSEAERELCEHAYSVFNSRFPAAYVRVDLVGSDDNLRINEIEAINPSYVTAKEKGLFTQEQLDYHNRRLEDMLNNFGVDND